MTLETAFNASIEKTFTSQRQTRRARRDETVDLRKARLLRLREVIVAHIDDIEQALFEDLRKTPTGGKSGEIASVLGDIDTAVAQLADWMAVKPVPSSPYLPNTAADRKSVV